VPQTCFDTFQLLLARSIVSRWSGARQNLIVRQRLAERGSTRRDVTRRSAEIDVRVTALAVEEGSHVGHTDFHLESGGHSVERF